jgi:hypothetical protein
MFHAFDVVAGESAQAMFARYVDLMVTAFVAHAFHSKRVLAQ